MLKKSILLKDDVKKACILLTSSYFMHYHIHLALVHVYRPGTKHCGYYIWHGYNTHTTLQYIKSISESKTA